MPLEQTTVFQELFNYGQEVLELNSSGGNIYVVSDLHLAAGVNTNDNYEGTENFMADFSFSRLINHLLANPTPHKQTLVINGDLVDFLRITSIPVKDAEFEKWRDYLASIGIVKTVEMLRASIKKREVKYGLQTDDFKSAWKLMIAASGHRPLFDSLAEWVNNGNQLVITKGNHDLEWYWKAVRDAFKLELCRAINATNGRPVGEIAREIVDPLVYFADQALLLDKQVYCEHGHRFERFTMVDGNPVLDNGTELNLPFGSFFNRYLINRVELAYPYIDNIRPRQQILSVLLRERFPLAVKLLFNYLPFALRVIPKKQYKFALIYLFQFLLIIALPLAVTIYAVFKYYHPPTVSTGGILTTILSGVKNLAFLSFSYFLGRLFSWLQLSGPASLLPFVKDIYSTSPPPTIVTFGHTHNPEKYVIKTPQRYFNTGTWMPVFEATAADLRVDKTFTILCISTARGGKLYTGELLRWNDDATRLDTLPLTQRQ